jgi:hypothetical protein
MKFKRIASSQFIKFLLLSFSVLITQSTFVLASLDSEIIKIKWSIVVCNIFCVILFTVGAFTALIIVLAGLKYMSSESPKEVNEAKRRILYGIIGLTFVIFATPFVNYLVNSFSPEPEKFECWCTAFWNEDVNHNNHNGDTTYPLLVEIIYPGEGSVFENDTAIWFLGRILGEGKPPYDFSWSSTPSGISRTKSKSENWDKFESLLPRGEYTITLIVTDKEGKSGTDEVRIRVIIPKPST